MTRLIRRFLRARHAGEVIATTRRFAVRRCSCAEAGFELELLRDAHNPAVFTFIARKPA